MNYYQQLGVNKNASPSEIKQAFKSLAMQHHPDRGGNATTFQKINNAYETLKDPVKRQQYDVPQQQRMNVNSSNFEDIFSQYFGQRQQVRRNKDIKIAYDLTLEDVATGKDVLAIYRLNNGQEVSANLKIHAGVHHGQVIRFANIGDNSYHQFPRGDLLVLCRVQPHPKFERDRHHLTTNIDVSVFDLILGTEYIITDLTGKNIRVNVKQGTKPGSVLSIAGHGLYDMPSNRTGNLYIKLRGIIPTLNEEQLKKVKEINDETRPRT